MTTVRVKDLLPPQPGPLTFVELGEILLREYGPEQIESGYSTTDPEWVGRYGIQYGDIEPDGSLT